MQFEKTIIFQIKIDLNNRMAEANEPSLRLFPWERDLDNLYDGGIKWQNPNRRATKTKKSKPPAGSLTRILSIGGTPLNTCSYGFTKINSTRRTNVAFFPSVWVAAPVKPRRFWSRRGPSMTPFTAYLAGDVFPVFNDRVFFAGYPCAKPSNGAAGIRPRLPQELGRSLATSR